MSFLNYLRRPAHHPPLVRFVDFNLAATILVLPFVMGGRHPWGHLLLAVFSVAAAVGCLLHQSQTDDLSWTRSPMRFILVAGVVLLIFQILPLPPVIQNFLSPNIQNLLPLSNGDIPAEGFARWKELSLAPDATRQGLVTLLAYGLLFATAVQWMRDISDVERALKWIAMAAIAMAAFGLLQYLLSNGRFFWIYEDPFRDTSDVVKGAFLNRNHFTHFLALGVPPLIGWLATLTDQTDAGRPRVGFASRRGTISFPIWLWLGFGMVYLAGLLSLSRGGIAAMGIATVLSVFLIKRAALLNSRLSWSMIGLGALVTVAIVIHGSQGVLNRLDEVTSGSLDKLDRSSGRRQIWSADLQAVTEFPLVGTGVGTHAAVYPIFFPKSSDELEYTHAESGYLQIAIETGIFGLTLALLTIGLVSRWCWGAFRESRSKRSRCYIAAITGSLAVSALHSLVDFVWFIPGCMATTVILSACAFRLWLLSKTPSQQVKFVCTTSQMRYRLAAMAVGAAGIWMVALCIGPAIAAPAWARYLRISVATTKADLLDADDAVRNNIALPDPAQRQSRHRAAIQSMIAELETVVRFDSTHVLARIRLAAARLQWFELLQQQTELPMPLAAVRDAALQSHFNSRAELDAWLDRAIGPHCAQLELARQEIHQALALCPLYGEAYLYMSDLCFLEGANSAAKNCYLLQALAVRPYDGEIHFEVGKECFLQGRTQQAIDHWRIAYHNSQEFKLRLIELFTNELAAQVPIDFFLNNFQPDLDGLRQLRAHFRRSPPSDQRTALWQYSTTAITKAAASQQGSAACPLWLEAELLYRELAEAGNRLVCVKQALAADASDYSAHYTAVNCYYDQNDLNSAADQVKWCLARAPNDANLKRIRDAIVKARLNTTPDPETTSLKITGIQPSEIRAPEAQHAVDTSIKR